MEGGVEYVTRVRVHVTHHDQSYMRAVQESLNNRTHFWVQILGHRVLAPDTSQLWVLWDYRRRIRRETDQEGGGGGGALIIKDGARREKGRLVMLYSPWLLHNLPQSPHCIIVGHVLKTDVIHLIHEVLRPVWPRWHLHSCNTPTCNNMSPGSIRPSAATAPLKSGGGGGEGGRGGEEEEEEEEKENECFCRCTTHQKIVTHCSINEPYVRVPTNVPEVYSWLEITKVKFLAKDCDSSIIVHV